MLVTGEYLNEIDYHKLGDRIKQYRKMRGLSQEELAEITNSSKNHIGYVETAKRSVSLVMLVRIANALNVSVEDLLFDSLKMVNSGVVVRFNQVLSRCSAEKADMLFDILKSIELVLLKHGIT